MRVVPIDTTPSGDTLATAFQRVNTHTDEAIIDTTLIAGVGWSSTVTNPTQPTMVVHSRGSERVRETYTYGVGGEADLVVQIDIATSSNAGGDWTDVGHWTLSYDAEHNFQSRTWTDA